MRLLPGVIMGKRAGHSADRYAGLHIMYRRLAPV